MPVISCGTKTTRRVPLHFVLKCSFAIVLIISCILMAACSSSSSSSQSQSQNKHFITKSVTYDSIADFNPDGKAIGVLAGTIYGGMAEQMYPNATVRHYSSYPDAVEAMFAGKVDAVIAEEPAAQYAAAQKGNVSCIDEVYLLTDVGVIMNKDASGYAYQEEFNDFLATIEASGKLETLRVKWLSGKIVDETMPDYRELPGTNGTLKVAINALDPPYCYSGDGGIYRGFEIELFAMFAEAYGYALDISNLEFSALIAAVNSGKVDMAADCISITEERKQSVLFSDPTFQTLGKFFVKQTKEDLAAAEATLTTLADVEGKKVGYMVGSSCEQYAIQVAGAEGEAMPFNSFADCIVALENNKIDAIVHDDPQALYLLAQDDGFSVIDEVIASESLAMVLRKDDERASVLCNQINEYLAQVRESGELRQLKKKWMMQYESDDQTINWDELTGLNGTISVAVTSAVGAPICYTKDGQYVGYDLDILFGFCKEYGYDVEIHDVEFSGMLASVQSGKYDIATSGFSITEERKQNMLFTDPIYDGSFVCVVKNSTSVAKGVFDGVISGFKKTFLTEDRWELFIGGILRTFAITLLSLVLGSVLGFLVYLWCRGGGRIRNRIVDFFIWLIQGMPTVVFLMVLFYIVFAASTVSGEVVSVVGFTLIFATVVVGLLRVGVSSVDKGQIEAATTLGYSSRKTFVSIVLPQAVRHILPAYRAEIVTLLKGTAIVGYIAVQDLTKVGDIVRARTYDAFFPLIAVAVIYFVLAALLKALINLIVKKTDPTLRSKEQILKGVREEDEQC